MMPARLDAVGASVPTDRSKRKASPYIPSSRRRPGSRRSFQVRTKGQNIVLRTSKILSGIRHAPCATRSAASFASAATRTNRNGVHVASERRGGRTDERRGGKAWVQK